MSDIQQNVAVIVEDHRLEVEKPLAELLQAPEVTVTIDDREIRIRPTSLATDPATNQPFARPTTIYDAARQVGVNIPILCHREHMTPVAVCRFCVVELGTRDPKDPSKVWWQGKLAPSCQRQVENGMVVKTHATSDKVKKSVQILTQLLLADHDVPRQAHMEYGDNELRTIAKQLSLHPHESPFPRTARDRGTDESSLVIAVDHNACILCDRCIRGCNEIRNNQVLGRMGKGYRARIAFDLNDPMGESSCVSCGECMVSCPTGALTNRKFVEPIVVDKGAEVVDPNELFGHPLFEGVSVQFMGWNKGSVVRRRYKKGEIICREGEFGNSAFILEKGDVEVYIAAQIKHAKAEKGHGKGQHGLFGLLTRYTTHLVRHKEDPVDLRDRGASGTARRYISVDAVTLDLESARPAATLTPNDLIFGEQACMNNYPRSATVVAKSDEVVVLEILRNVLYVLQRNKRSKAMLEAVYRNNAISGHLRSVSIFGELQRDARRFEQFVDEFRQKMRLVRFNPGEVVFRQGDTADALYLVRTGFVKVSQRRPGGDHVLTYIGPGGFFGEIGLLSSIPELRGKVDPGVRTATCSALDHLDVVKIDNDSFLDIIERYPTVRAHLVAEAQERVRVNAENARKVQSDSMGEFVKQGLMNAQSLLVLDLTKCTRCDECTKACSDAHYEPKLGTGITRLIRDGLRFDNWLVASSCRSCLDPYCMVGCPVDSIHRKESREMIIEDWCIRCGNCAKNCPYGNINMAGFPTGEKHDDPNNPGVMVPVIQEKATMCDLCMGIDGQPSCCYACPHDAAHRYTGDQFRDIFESKHARSK
jgi:CRP-like cAMP-binding protein/Fe-S-cluster-containing hydrogenase component 2